MFAKLDENGDGQVSYCELKRGMSKLCSQEDKELAHQIWGANTDGDCVVTRAEFNRAFGIQAGSDLVSCILACV